MVLDEARRYMFLQLLFFVFIRPAKQKMAAAQFSPPTPMEPFWVSTTAKSDLCAHRSAIVLLVALSAVLLALEILVPIALFFWYKRREIRKEKMKRSYFYRNKGLLLQQLISSDPSAADKTKIFPLDELERATNNFDTNRILGGGGHGTVYKGILTDQRVVAIKKSKVTDLNEIEQFINEVAILSQINHRNVVKLYGCCLETEVPLLVYEFVSNGTLSDHLHNSNRLTPISWNDRLRIASESASALFYLHSAASISVFHRDVKSPNILLDDTYATKVSDFGASRIVALDQTHITTIVQGTLGYLDPEYFQTGQLSEKSDVYSFGVILAELLTGEKAISLTQDRNLATRLLYSVENNQIFELVDNQLINETTRDEIEQVAKLAALCVRERAEERPSMKEVEATLAVLRKANLQQPPPHDFGYSYDASSRHHNFDREFELSIVAR